MKLLLQLSVVDEQLYTNEASIIVQTTLNNGYRMSGAPQKVLWIVRTEDTPEIP